MIALDTNVLVRFIVQDDKTQSRQATAIIDQLTSNDPGFITQVAVVELVWVVQSCYKATKDEVVSILDKLLRTPELVVENALIAMQALQLFKTCTADYSDCVIERTAKNAGCEFTFTFDAKAAKTAGMRLIC